MEDHVIDRTEGEQQGRGEEGGYDREVQGGGGRRDKRDMRGGGGSA